MPHRTSVVALLAGVVLAALGYSWWASQPGDAGGILFTSGRLTIPGIGRGPQSASSSPSWVGVSVDMTREEDALTQFGSTDIILSASAGAPLPGGSGPAVAASAYLTIGAHPDDECAWSIEGGSGSLVLTFSRSPVSGIRITIGIASDVSWYYMVQCPGVPPPPPMRFPQAPVDESFGGWLGLILPGIAGAGVTVDVPVVTDPYNVFFGRCEGTLESANEFGTVKIHVIVEDLSCKLPTPTPPTADPYAPCVPAPGLCPRRRRRVGPQAFHHAFELSGTHSNRSSRSDQESARPPKANMQHPGIAQPPRKLPVLPG